jgi:hypothetical protein
MNKSWVIVPALSLLTGCAHVVPNKTTHALAPVPHSAPVAVPVQVPTPQVAAPAAPVAVEPVAPVVKKHRTFRQWLRDHLHKH